jgi:predicted O-methyltransferase YrrM
MTWMDETTTPVHCVQLKEEFEWLLDIYEKLKPRRVLEIGSHVGGALYHFMQRAPKGSNFTSVSMGATPHIRAWVDWANQHGHGLEILDADSTALASVEWMQIQAPYDFVFIDGSHWYEYVSKDWENARGMVRKGGIVAFHDITDHGGMPNERVDVPDLWREIKAEKKGAVPRYKTAEKVALPGVYCGIGVVYL